MANGSAHHDTKHPVDNVFDRVKPVYMAMTSYLRKTTKKYRAKQNNKQIKQRKQFTHNTMKAFMDFVKGVALHLKIYI